MSCSPLLSIIIINYNAKNLTTQCIDSIFSSHCSISFEILVIENGGDSKEEYFDNRENVKIIKNIENHGFGHACNTGAQQAQGEYLLFLNNDTIMHPHVLDCTIEYMCTHQTVGALGVQTLLADGTLDHGCKRGFPTPMASLFYFMGLDKKFPQSHRFGAYRQTFVSANSVCAVDAVSGAFLLMPAKLFAQLGGFDETFFMYGEDLDLCYRIKEAHFDVVYYGTATITHLKGQSGLHTSNPKVRKAFYDAMHIFFDKHYRKKYGRVVSMIIHAAINIKYLMAKF